MANLTLPPSVRDVRGQAIEAIVNRLAQIDLSPLLVYRIDTVPAAALPFLAWQFDLLSPLWALLAPANPAGIANSATASNRALIKAAIALHRMRGTPAAILEALSAIGYPNATILEGQNSWGGFFWPASEGWAVCRIKVPLPIIGPDSGIAAWDPGGATSYGAGALVAYGGLYFYALAAIPAGLPPQYDSIDDVPAWDTLTNTDLLVPYPWFALTAGETIPVSTDQVQLIEAIFNFFKPVRAWLDSVWFVDPPFADTAPVPGDLLTVNGLAVFGADAAPPPAEGALNIHVALTFAENYPPISPLQNAHFKQKGHNQGANEPLVADSVIVINGVTDGESQ